MKKVYSAVFILLLSAASAQCGWLSGGGGGTGTFDGDAGDVPVTPVGGIAATDVQSAVEELDTEKVNTADIATVSTDVATMMGSANDAEILNNIGAQPAVSGVSSTEIGYLDGVTSGIQAQINAITVGSPVTTVPTYSDSTCTKGQYAISTSPSMYWCIDTNTWDYQVVSGSSLVWAGWDNPTPVTYSLTMAITDTTGTGSTFTVNSEAADVGDTPKTWTGLNSATEAVTFTPNSDETSSCTGTGVTGTDPNWVVDMSSGNVTDMACTVSASGYCDDKLSGIDFYLDFDHPDGSTYACITSGTETGTGDYSSTPSTVSPGSGALAINSNATGDYIEFRNNAGYFSSQYGSILFYLQLVSDNTESSIIQNITAVAGEDRMYTEIFTNGTLNLSWEDNNHGIIQVPLTRDLDGYYGDWAQVFIRWDTTRCTDGTCDGTGEDELCISIRIDDNRDGDFGDGGVEDWLQACESSAVDLGAWSAEPSSSLTGSFVRFGITTTVTGTDNIYEDDIKISNGQPAWSNP